MPHGEGERVRGHRKLAVIHALADGQLSQQEIADKYNLSQPGVSYIARTNVDEIAAIKADAERELTEAWIAKKVARVWTYQGAADHLLDVAELVEAEKVPSIYKGVFQAMRNVAEELGHLQPKENVSGSLTVRLEGVDGDAL